MKSNTYPEGLKISKKFRIFVQASTLALSSLVVSFGLTSCVEFASMLVEDAMNEGINSTNISRTKNNSGISDKARKKQEEQLKKEGKCLTCKGMGKTPDGKNICPTCNGTGKN